MKKILSLSIFFLFGCSPTIFELSEQNILHDESLRTFYTYVPSDLGKDMTLVVGLHGYTGNARTFIRYGDADFNYFKKRFKNVKLKKFEEMRHEIQNESCKDELLSLMESYLSS